MPDRPAPPPNEAIRAGLRALGSRAPFLFPDEAIPSEFRRSSVLLPFFEDGGDLRVVLTRRSPDLRGHAGQVAFPGGRLEAGETWEEAALRESQEEIDLDPGLVEVLGRLDDAWSGAGHHVAPIVGWLREPPVLRANPDEVDEIMIAPVPDLYAPDARDQEIVHHDGRDYLNRIVRWPGGQVYGFSADLLIEALDLAAGASPGRGPERLAELRTWYARGPAASS